MRMRVPRMFLYLAAARPWESPVWVGPRRRRQSVSVSLTLTLTPGLTQTRRQDGRQRRSHPEPSARAAAVTDGYH
jgi:hypothetical protein